MRCPNCDGEMTGWAYRDLDGGQLREQYICSHCDYTETR